MDQVVVLDRTRGIWCWVGRLDFDYWELTGVSGESAGEGSRLMERVADGRKSGEVGEALLDENGDGLLQFLGLWGR